MAIWVQQKRRHSPLWGKGVHPLKTDGNHWSVKTLEKQVKSRWKPVENTAFEQWFSFWACQNSTIRFMFGGKSFEENSPNEMMNATVWFFWPETQLSWISDARGTHFVNHLSYLEWNRSSDLDLRIFFSFSEEKFSLGWAALNSNFHSVFKKNEPITGLKRTLSISPHQATKRWSIHRLSWRVLLKRLPPNMNSVWLHVLVFCYFLGRLKSCNRSSSR